MEILHFGGEMPGKIEIKARFKREDIEEIGFAFPKSTRMLAVDTSFYKVVRALTGNDEDLKINVAQNGTTFLAEYVVDGIVSQMAMFDTRTKTVKAVEVNEAGAYSPYNEGAHGGTILRAVLTAGMTSLRNKGFNRCLEELEKYSKFAPDDDEFEDGIVLEALGQAMCGVTSYIYYWIKDNFGSPNLPITTLRMSEVKAFETATIVYGEPSFVKEGADGMRKKATKGMEMKVIVGEYAINPERKFSALEESLIPKMPDTYVCPNEAKTIPRDIKQSEVFAEKYRNILLVGDSGGGKTTLAKAIAAELGLPYTNYSCGPDTDAFDTMGGIQPTTEKVRPEDLYKKFGIPSFEDVANDFETVFKKLFNKEPGKFNGPEDCYEEINKRLMDASKVCDDFTYVPSNIILGAINGWVVEIQEATIIKRESELVVLNALLENVEGTPITLPNGKVITRHPDSVFIFTSNMNYKGCKSLQESVLSRCNMRREIKTPEVEVLAERAIAQCKTAADLKMPKFPKDLVVKMATITKEVDTYCKDHDITDGVCGPRELNDWCKKAIMTSYLWGEEEVTADTVAKCCWPVFCEKISQIPEEVEEVVTAILQKHFSAEAIEEGRILYENGEI